MARKGTRAEKPQEAVLRDIEQAKERLVELRSNVARVREKYISPDYLAGGGQQPPRGTAAEIEAARGMQEYIEWGDAEIARLEAELPKAWAVFSGLSDTPGRLPGSDEDLAAELSALESRRKSLAFLAGRFREDYHERLDNLLNEYVGRFDALVAGDKFGEFEVEESARLWAFKDDAFRARLHAGVDAHRADAFSPGTRSSWQEECDLLNRQIVRRQSELRAREAERAAAEAETAKQAALGAVTGDT